MERPTSALHLTRVTLSLRELGAEPHKKEVGHHAVYPLIAFDQHAATTVAAVLLPGQRTPALHTLSSDSPAILRFVKRLARETGAVLRCCYEAGPCGFELQRAMAAAGVPCEVIAPALIPRRPGDRIKTDRRDAGQLAVLYHAGALTAIHVPTDQFSDLPDFDAVIVTSRFCIRRRDRPSPRRDDTNRSTPSARPYLPFSPADRSWIQREPIALAVEASPSRSRVHASRWCARYTERVCGGDEGISPTTSVECEHPSCAMADFRQSDCFQSLCFEPAQRVRRH
jgi:hypothetical protein